MKISTSALLALNYVKAQMLREKSKIWQHCFETWALILKKSYTPLQKSLISVLPIQKVDFSSVILSHPSELCAREKIVSPGPRLGHKEGGIFMHRKIKSNTDIAI